MENLAASVNSATIGETVFGSQSVGQFLVSKVTVSLKTNDMLGLLAKSIAKDISFRLNVNGTYDFKLLTESNLTKYFQILIINRLRIVEGQRPIGLTRSETKSITMPATIFVLLNSIGKVKDTSNGIVFEPTANEELLAIISGQEFAEIQIFMKSIEAQLDSLKDVGLTKTLVKGMPQQEEGDIDFMTSEIIAEELRSYRNGMMRSAVYRMFLDSIEIQTKFRNLMNVRYIDSAAMTEHIYEFARL